MAMMKLVGASVKRVEDNRFVRGLGNYTDDVRLPGTLHVAFVRSPHAHARIRRIDTAAALALPGVRRVFTGADLEGRVKAMGLPLRKEQFPFGVFQQAPWVCMPTTKVRHVGEPVAAVIADSRYLAEDGAERVEVDYEPLPAVVDAEQACAPGAPLVHDEHSDNLVMQVDRAWGDVEGGFQKSTVVVREKFYTNRHVALPMESRATLAAVGADGILTLWTSSQMPHLVRTRVAELIDWPEHKMRVISPDVGGGFGLKCHVFLEEVLTAFFAAEVGAPVKWIEDRRENLIGSFHAKDDIVDCEMGFAEDGTLLAMRARVLGDLGAYGADPWPSCLEAVQLAYALTGHYKVNNYACDIRAVNTNKTTLSVYRGVGLPAAILVQEHLIDNAARKLGMDPVDVRRKNMIRPEEFPYTIVTGETYDSGSSTKALDKALEAVDYPGFRRRQAEARRQGRRLGIGISSYVEATTFGTGWWNRLGIQHSAYESASVKMEPNGGATVTAGTHSHGQGHATVYAQIVADELGIDVKDVNYIQGDTAATTYGWGTWGSRSAVAGGGAVHGAARQVREKMMRIAAHMLEVNAGDLELDRGSIRVKGVPTKSVAVKDIAKAAVFSYWQLPPGEAPGLEAFHYWDPPVTYANSTHVAEVEVDIETGNVKLVRYLVVEDCGQMINPMLVEAQVAGGVVQGVGAALFEHVPFDENGQPLATSLMDYLVPTAADVPNIEVEHLETLSPLTALGIKGMGEGGTIGPPGAIVNAVADALGGAMITRIPLTPELVWQLARESSAARER
ncbi:MAG: xanthine dehydrogenase family protein molybdopterin-binding subunit [Candidatus Binatia bacterium]